MEPGADAGRNLPATDRASANREASLMVVDRGGTAALDRHDHGWRRDATAAGAPPA